MRHYAHHIGDFNHATRHLTRIERSIYRDMMDMYYDTERPLPADVDLLARKIMARTKDERAAVDLVLAEFFTLESDGYHNARCDAEIAIYQGFVDAGRRGAEKRWGGVGEAPEKGAHSLPNGEGNSPPTPGPIPTSNHEPRTKGNTRVAVSRPDDVPEKVWADFIAVRKAKRAPLTTTALDGIRAEADKAGLTLADAISECCSRGWQGFKAEWVAGKPGTTGKKTTSDWRPPELR